MFNNLPLCFLLLFIRQTLYISRKKIAPSLQGQGVDNISYFSWGADHEDDID